MIDALGRSLRDLRISVTDRCNFRCGYCMPRDAFGADYRFLPRREILSFEEIERVVRVFASLGTRKIRLTGGEPLLWRQIERLVERLARIPGIGDLALTTNASLLEEKASSLRRAGLGRITVSLDALEEDVFAGMSDTTVPVAQVLRGIEAAERAGFRPIKLNAVVRRAMNEESVLPLVRRFRGTGHVVRFIEYMDVGATNGWSRADVVPAAEILARIDREFPLERVPPAYPGEVANRWRFRDGAGEIGVIASITAPFCGDCTRARLSPEGRLFTCLFAPAGHDLRPLLRGGASDRELAEAVTGIWKRRDDRYSELRRLEASEHPGAEMSYLGG